MQSSDESDVRCYGNEAYSFNQLKLKNVSSYNLYSWHAPIDTINNYQRYLVGDDMSLSNHSYCNCSGDWFGTRCQYSFGQRGTAVTFDEVIISQYKRKPSLRENFDIVNDLSLLTCYEGLQCHSTICLDWRQICDGNLNCEYGEDEPDECLLLELNECQNNEYRCRNGMCIPKTFLLDFTYDCMDLSDEKNAAEVSWTVLCYNSPGYDCDFALCRQDKYSCGDGSCASSNEPCQNGRHLFLRQNLLLDSSPYHNNRSANISFECWFLMLCMSGQTNTNLFGYQYDTCFCSIHYEELSSCWDYFRKHCPTSFMFQTEKNLLFPFTRFLFHNSSNNLNEWYQPTHVCYNRTSCPYLILQDSLWFDGLLCIERETVDALEDLSESAFQLVFSVCNLLNMPTFFDDKRLFYCSQSKKLISKYRVTDGFEDCLYIEDEDRNVNNTRMRALNFTGTDRFKCATTDEWFPRPMIASDSCYAIGCCADKSHRLYIDRCIEASDIGCEVLRGVYSPPINYIFRENCNGIWKQQFFVENETDETSCDEWPVYPCDGPWDVSNGEDELNCPNTIPFYIARTVLMCSVSEHYCMDRNGTMGCLPKERAGDGTIDCLGATDERTTHCTSLKNVADVFNCFSVKDHCTNLNHLCNNRFSCPDHDDELVCPWLKDFVSDSYIESGFICKSGKLIDRSKQCDNIIDCIPEAEDEWFCDLKEIRSLHIALDRIEEYPPVINKSPHLTIATNIRSSASSPIRQTTSSRSNNPPENWYCNRGIIVIKRPSNDECLCPPSYYGSRCQYQAERLLITLQIDKPARLSGRDHEESNIRIVARLMFDDAVVHHEQILHVPSMKQIFYLNYPRPPPKQRGNWSVRLDAFVVTVSSVDYKASWLFDVPFSFLPFNRLTLHLLLKDPETCTTLTCVHGTCKKYLNLPHRDYCQCNQNWSGKQCNVSSVCSCAQGGNCVDRHPTSICVCPLGRMGSNCQASFNPCIGIECEHDGVCIPLDERQSIKWLCVCSEEYYGDHCELTHAQVDIHFSKSLFTHDISLSATVFTYFLALQDDSPGILLMQNRLLYRQVQLEKGLRIYNKNYELLRGFIVLEIFFEPDRFGYYVAAIIKNWTTNINTTISESNRCPHVDELLSNETIRRFPSTKKVKYYHHVCKVSDSIKWFYDEAYLCFCDIYRIPECVFFQRQSAQCTTDYCKNNGRCVQNNFKGIWDFGCVCSGCSYGSLCQITTSQYALSLDAMLGQDIRENVPLKDQPMLIKILLIVLVLMLSIGFVSNILSLMTFKQAVVQQFGCGVYLFYLPIIGQFGLTILAGRFFYLLGTQIYDVKNLSTAYWGCVSLEYFLSVCPALFAWLTACVAVERSVNVIKGISFRKSDSVWWAKRVVILLTIIVLASAWHEPFVRQLIDDPRSTTLHTWCVITFSRPWLEYYRLTVNLINLFVPGSIIFVATVFLLHKSTRMKQLLNANRGKKGYWKILKKQLPLYGGPFVLVILSLIRLVFSFTLVCIIYQWQKYVYLTAYTISFVPLMATFPIFVLPAKIYRTEFKSLVERLSRKLKITKS